MTHRCFEHPAIQVASVLRLTSGLFVAFLMTGMLHAAEPLPASALANAGQSYTVQRGDTLDRVIQKTMATSPLKIELLRQAFVVGNPHAFVSGNVSRLRAGAVLQVPDHAKLLRSVVLPVLDASNSAALAGESRSSNASDRRSWIRFP
jgi:Tfp pilus assembly protein FimV